MLRGVNSNLKVQRAFSNHAAKSRGSTLVQRRGFKIQVEGGRSSVSGVVATVFGATGSLGHAVVNQLGRFGSQVVVPYRGTQRSLHRIQVMGDVGQIVPVEWDIRNPDSIHNAVKHSNVVMNMLNQDYSTWNYSMEEVHVDGARMIAQIAADSGVDRFIHVSTANYDVNSPNEWIRTKSLGEDAVREVFPDATIIRPTIIYGNDFVFPGNLVYWMRRAWPFMAVTEADQLLQPVWSGDVADGIVATLKTDKSIGETYDFGGPRVYSFGEFVEFLRDTIGVEVDIKVPGNDWWDSKQMLEFRDEFYRKWYRLGPKFIERYARPVPATFKSRNAELNALTLERVLAFVNPTPENIRKFKEWMSLQKQVRTDQLKEDVAAEQSMIDTVKETLRARLTDSSEERALFKAKVDEWRKKMPSDYAGTFKLSRQARFGEKEEAAEARRKIAEKSSNHYKTFTGILQERVELKVAEMEGQRTALRKYNPKLESKKDDKELGIQDIKVDITARPGAPGLSDLGIDPNPGALRAFVKQTFGPKDLRQGKKPIRAKLLDQFFTTCFKGYHLVTDTTSSIAPSMRVAMLTHTDKGGHYEHEQQESTATSGGEYYRVSYPMAALGLVCMAAYTSLWIAVLGLLVYLVFFLTFGEKANEGVQILLGNDPKEYRIRKGLEDPHKTK